MRTGEAIKSGAFGGSGLVVPAACTMIAQFMQHLFAVGFDASDLAGSSLLSPVLLFSFLKIVALVVLAVHCARFFAARHGASTPQHAKARADRFLILILAVNLAFASLILAGVGFIESGSFDVLAERGLSRTGAKVALLLLVFALIAPLNKRVFRDVSLAIGGEAVPREKLPFDPNKAFLKSLTRNAARYILPAYAAHVLIGVGIEKSGGLLVPLAAADAIVLAALGLVAGYAIFLSHEEVAAGAGLPAADRLPRR